MVKRSKISKGNTAGLVDQHDMSRLSGKGRVVKTAKVEYSPTDKSHSKKARELDNLRKKYKRRAANLEKTAEQMTYDGKERVYAEELFMAARSLRHEASMLTVANITKAKKGTTEYYSDLNVALRNANRRIEYVGFTDAKTENKREVLGNIQMRYAAKEIMVFTQNKLWHGGMSNEERWQALRNEVKKHSKEVLGREVSAPTNMDIIDYFERAIQMHYGKPDYSIRREPFMNYWGEEQFRYEVDLREGLIDFYAEKKWK